MVAALGCAATSHPASPPPPRLTCLAGSAGVSPVDSLSVATTGPIGASHAPNPTNAAERFVFAQAYETLVGVDCEGRAYASLARSWTIDATKTRVTFTLRDDARFWNGDPVAARDVVAAWQATAARSSDSLARRVADATTIVDDHTLTVSLPDTSWLVLGEPELAVYRPATGTPWPLGSGPYRVAESAMDVASGRLALTPVAPRAAPRLLIRSGPDERDAIDAGVDVLLGVDPVAARYAATRPDLAPVPVPWNRTYVLAAPSRRPGIVAEVLATTGDSAAAFRASLARDAVRAEARPANQPGWWDGVSDCALNPPTGVFSRGNERPWRIVYRADDRVSRELAQRLVALGGRGTATPLGIAEFARELRSGDDVAYVVWLPHMPLAPCHDLAALVSDAPWLVRGGSLGDALVPLVDTRESVIVNRRRVSATVDWDGTLHIASPATRP
jgi:Bacterial extracellular solute-binding proteins, family 5 Middle